jgi:hypothetical protein
MAVSLTGYRQTIASLVVVCKQFDRKRPPTAPSLDTNNPLLYAP